MTGVVKKLGISGGEVIGITLVPAYRSKLVGDEVLGPVLSVGYFEGARDVNL